METIKDQISNQAKRLYPRWVNGGEFERMAMDLNYKASNASRRCRELVAEGRLERRITLLGKSVEYRYIPQPSDMLAQPFNDKYLQQKARNLQMII